MKKRKRRILRPRHASPRARGAAPLAAAAAPRGLGHRMRRSGIGARELKTFRSQVIGYWKQSGRDHLPWRKARDPYAILVSEIMLQQTQVGRVIPYFERWMKAYPTPSVLAKAPLADVLRRWSGLGYNRRAKYLHEAAKAIVARHEGKVPRGCGDLRALPGIGDYTAKAVRVFAWNVPETFIETNVRAVFIHHFYPRGRAVSDARLLPLIAEAVEGQDPRTWYAALMDYGTFLKAMHPNPSRKSRHHTKQSKFEGSLRQVRGAIVRARVKGESLDTVRARYPRRFVEALAALKRDGLV